MSLRDLYMGAGYFASSIGRDTSPPTISYSCDERAHVAGLPADTTKVAPGSSALVTGDGSFWKLTTDGVWREI